jgi:hypothetical protein
MLHLIVLTILFTEQHITHAWWQRIRPILIIFYLTAALTLLLISGVGQFRLLDEVGKVFGGFTWVIDTGNSNGKIVIISIPSELPPLAIPAGSLTNDIHITAVNHVNGIAGLQQAYQHAHPNEPITYTAQEPGAPTITVTRPAVIFTLNMWWQIYGLAFLTGASWLIVGLILIAKASEWTGAVEGQTMLPAAALFLLSSHWGNINAAVQTDLVAQMLWIPSFALLGAAFIHLSLNYRPIAHY